MSGQVVLTSEQTAALLDILTHHGTYAEIEAFKTPRGVTGFGYPFRRETRVPPGPPSRGSRSRTTTPSGSVPSTPRARTPVSMSFLWGGGGSTTSSSSRDDKKRDIAGEVGTMTEVGKGQDQVRDRDRDGGGDEKRDEDDGEDEEDEKDSKSPLLQMLLERLVLPFPGVKELSRDFWGVKVQGLLARFGEAGLSESYDKGAMGTRKTLASGAGSVLETLTRGMLSGVKEDKGLGRDRRTTAPQDTLETQAQEVGGDKRRKIEKQGERCSPLMGHYNLETVEGLESAWEDCLQEWAYGDLLDQLFDHFSETKDIESHSPAVRGTVDYAIVHIATFAHQIFILSPEGQYLIKLLESINNLVPYRMITQTLRVGNAAVMISGMVRLLLTKLSVTSLTNWVGLTANADDGMNLLQRIIWIVLTYDASEFRKSADKIEKARDGEEDKPPEEVLQAIREHVAKPWEDHDTVRRTSLERSQSIIMAVLESAGTRPKIISRMSEAQHAQCLAYYSALLSARDRDAIVNVLCRQPPDLFTQILKDVIAAFDPLIRSVHARVDLREHLESFQQFLSEFIRASKPKKSENNTNSTPTIIDNKKNINNNNNNGNNNGNGSGSKSTTNGGQRASTEDGRPPSPDVGETRASVEDYVKLLRDNKGLLFNWIHAVAKECPDVWAEMRVWAKAVAIQFRERAVTQDTHESAGDTKQGGPLKDMQGCLEDLLLSLDPEARSQVLAATDAHAIYLSDITLQSRQRLQRILTKSACPSPLSAGMTTRETSGKKTEIIDVSCVADDMCGPGVYLFRWQDLLDCTPITPAQARGAPRRGIDVKHTTTMGKLGLGGMIIGAEEGRAAQGPGRKAPDVSVVVTALGEKFRVAVRDKGSTWG